MAVASAVGLAALLVGIVTAATLLTVARAQRRESAALSAARRRTVRLQVRHAEQRAASTWRMPLADATQLVGSAVSGTFVRGSRRLWRAALRRTTATLGAPVPDRRFAERLDTAVLQVADDE
jgi:hypothetical protein